MNLPPLIRPDIPFLASKDSANPQVVLVGLPLDLTESFRSGTAEGPSGIRSVSDVLESFSPDLGRDLDDVSLCDLGDLPLSGMDLLNALSAIRDLPLVLPRTALPIFLGGEHTVSLPLVEAFQSKYPNIAVIQVDAHADLIGEFRGQRLCHATVFRRIAEHIGPRSLVQVGIRSGTREEFEYARSLLHSSKELALPPEVRLALSDRPVYLSIDIDVLDPSVAPGTGCPEPGGPGFSEVMAFLYSLHDLRVVAVDLVEVAPKFDPAGITAAAAAKLVRELSLTFGTR